MSDARHPTAYASTVEVNIAWAAQGFDPDMLPRLA